MGTTVSIKCYIPKEFSCREKTSIHRLNRNGEEVKGKDLRKKYSFSNEDILQIKALGLTLADVDKQLTTYRRGATFLKLVRPCIPGDGIRSFSAVERNRLIKRYDTEATKHSILKFVPASGAASRMFAAWFTAAQQGSFGNTGLDRSFFADLRKMPFYPTLEKDDAVRLMLKKRNVKTVLDRILLANGLQFGWLPKALIPFHAYRNGEVRTALEEHLVEAASFNTSVRGICRLHFTISAEHAKAVKALLKEIIPRYEKRRHIRFKIDLSEQSQATNIIAADEKNLPLRDDEGHLVFRPGGHGALLNNLQALDADLIVVKNIDNIAPDALKRKILSYHKMLGGLALQLRQSIFAMLRHLEKDQIDSQEIEAMIVFCKSELNRVMPKNFSNLTLTAKKKTIFKLLNRPLRVCGMVQNEGEPGGGPFWVQEKDQSQTLQIVESAHVDHNCASQKDIWSRASHFNPVDMVCCTKNYLGEKFDLADYVNQDAYLISPKTERGRKLKAQEMPGLWNGGMSYWNTVFVELPLMVFNPVKTVYDLLRDQHRGGANIK
ncbi:MAG TPA: DUF4301 family protein [Smithellaceae bacterium]|nr:DUF4301 family protein [Smithellaceae bacterium]